MRLQAAPHFAPLISLFAAHHNMASLLTVETTMLPPHSAIFEKGAPRPPSYALARTSLIVTLLAAPLAFGAVQEWAWGAMAVVAFLLLLFWSIAGARQGGLRILWSPLYLPAGLFFLLGMIQFRRISRWIPSPRGKHCSSSPPTSFSSSWPDNFSARWPSHVDPF